MPNTPAQQDVPAAGVPIPGPSVAAPASSALSTQASAATPYIAPSTGAAGNLLSSPSWQSQVAGYLSGAYSSAEAQSVLGAGLGSAQLGLIAPQLGVSSAELENQAGYSLAAAALGYQGTGLQSQALAEQAGTAAAQQGLEQGMFGISMTQYPEQQAEATQQFQLQQQALQDQAAGAGTTSTQGAQRAIAANQAQYGWNMADIYRNQQLAALGQQSEQVGYGGQQALTANQQQQLSLAAQQQGLDVQQVYNQLGFGLQQLGVQASPESYLATIANAQAGGAQQLAALGYTGGLIGGLGTSNTAAILAALGL
jgi:hypothetical protein